METPRSKKANKITLLGFVLNFGLSVLKVFTGLWGHSGAVIADGIHSLSDCVTDVGIIWGFRISDKPRDNCHRYGHGKMETLVTLLLGLVLVFVAVKIFLYGAVNILKVVRGGVLLRPSGIAFIAAIISVILKEWLYRVTMRVGIDIDSKALIANAWHHRSDVFSSIGVAVGVGGAILLGEKWRILDPIAAAVVSIFILRIAGPIIMSSGNELIEASLGEEADEEILEMVRNVEGAQIPHNLKTRHIGQDIAVDIHIKVNRGLSITEAHDISTEVEKKLKERYGSGTFVTVHVEPMHE